MTNDFCNFIMFLIKSGNKEHLCEICYYKEIEYLKEMRRYRSV